MSPVLTPVENAHQWRQLKFREGNLEKTFESNDMYDIKSRTHRRSHDVFAITDRSISEFTMDSKREEGWDENEEPELWGVRGCMHAQNAQMQICKDSLPSEFTYNNMHMSKWLTTPQPVKGATFENLTTLPRCQNEFDVHRKSSPWTGKLVNDWCEDFTQRSSEPFQVDLSLSNWLHVPFKQDEANGCTISAAGLVRQQSPARCRNERPILGLITGDMNSNSSIRKVHWDGQGIPNTTTKYKEDQRVNWHATPFEARLERALNRKVYEEEEMTPVSNRLKSLQ
ncbi:hypothetical protein L7F22_004486 [Adiantum nelumboides]|nr:hypothetical protein [Adiantum nelumboides]